jgi:peptide/nickel transport system permease protein
MKALPIKFINFLRIFLFITVAIGLVLQPPPVSVNLDLVNLGAWQDLSHPLGCDRLGRDVFAMYSYGVLSTILIAIPARILTLVFSIFISLASFTLGRLFSFFLDQLSYVFLSIPSLLVALLVVAGLGASFFSLPIAIVLSDWAVSYESLKSRLRELEKSGYVFSSYAMGAGKFHVFRRHILPGMFSMVWYLFVTGVPTVIMALAIFSFLGVDWSGDLLGPGLGEQIAFSGDYYGKNPSAVIVPIFGIVLLVLSLGKR